MRVFMLIMNAMRYEGRVVREAQALGKEGHEVAVLAFAEQGAQSSMEIVIAFMPFERGPPATKWLFVNSLNQS
jgi:hypothetical protein